MRLREPSLNGRNLKRNFLLHNGRIVFTLPFFNDPSGLRKTTILEDFILHIQKPPITIPLPLYRPIAARLCILSLVRLKTVCTSPLGKLSTS